MTPPPAIPVARTGALELGILPRLANRHGLVAGATGTGKTVTLQVLAEGFSRIGTPVFVADVKGDLAGIATAGAESPKLMARIEQLGLGEFEFKGTPVTFWDIFGEQGHPIRTTVSEMGPLLLGRLLDLNDTQTGVLHAAFRIADDSGMLLLDLKDLRAMLQHVGDEAKKYRTEYGNIAPASVGAIQRSLLTLEEQGGDFLFGEPELELADLLRTDLDGRGMVNILASDRLMRSPKMYATFLLWLLSELFEQLPEVGDPERPRLVFFFDEAHLLFDDAPQALREKIEQVVRLIRSKGVGVYFVTQNPLDLPDEVLGQLGNRVQHALRAFTPRDQKAVRAAAETFRVNPELDVETAITELGVGEALVSFLDEKGRPGVVERAYVRPPYSRMGPLTAEERASRITSSPLHGRYEKLVDRESAYEMLRSRAEQAAVAAEAMEQQKEAEKAAAAAAKAQAAAEKERQKAARASSRKSNRMTPLEAMTSSAMRSIGTQIGRSIIRGMFGTAKR
ncbi:MAG TPA: helicase HerA-like domain-containing protein [Gemmatimonadales bacterium]|nr:helicase HerA-like domain-containing protein [Gemmatimonadales bacterium]